MNFAEQLLGMKCIPLKTGYFEFVWCLPCFLYAKIIFYKDLIRHNEQVKFMKPACKGFFPPQHWDFYPCWPRTLTKWFYNVRGI